MKKIGILLAFTTCCLCTTAQLKKKKSKTKAPMEQSTFRKASWIHNTDVYEVNLRQYTKEGTFNAFLPELPRLKKMGVSTLWFMPITPIAQKNKKGTMGSQYACSDYTAVNPEFGTLEDFRSLVKTAHSQGFKVIIDWVANHTGWDHVWTKTHPEYFEKDTATNDFKIASGMDDIIELDFRNRNMRRAMIDAMKYWVTECDIDGFRCDLAFWVELDFWLEARAELEKTKTLFWLAESDPIDHPEYYRAFDACYTWTWMHRSKDFYQQKWAPDSLRDVLQRYDKAGDANAIKLWFTTNHDENSWNGTEYEKYGVAAAALAVHSFTWNGIPLVYSGQELPNRKRLQFFEKDPIDWSGPCTLNDFYAPLYALRKSNPALRAGDPAVRTYWVNSSENQRLVAYLRRNGNREVLVLLNMSASELRANLHDREVSGEYRDAFSGERLQLPEGITVTLPAWGYRVLEK
jgi:glycosidase